MPQSATVKPLLTRGTDHGAALSGVCGSSSAFQAEVADGTSLAQAVAMATATWNGTVLASSDDTVVVEGNHYFPRESVTEGVLVDSSRTSVCPWKGTASYSSVVVDGQVNQDAAWYYPDPKEAAAQIKDRVAFWKGVEVTG